MYVEHQVYDPQSPAERTARAVHAASGDLLDRWIQIFGGVGPAVPMRSAFARFQRFVKHPSLHEARFFGDMVHVGGLGTTPETRPIASPPSLGDALRHPRAFQTAYRESLWQLAFVQRVVRSNAVARCRRSSVARLTRSAAAASSPFGERVVPIGHEGPQGTLKALL